MLQGDDDLRNFVFKRFEVVLLQVVYELSPLLSRTVQFRTTSSVFISSV